MVKKVIKNLIEKNISITTAESCTGGLIASEIVKNSGVSAIYSGSIVSYSNEIKHKLLKVEEEVLKRYGAVSKECVEQMCYGVQKIFEADIAIAVSGIAGPDGGSKEKPVGTVFIAVLYKNELVIEKNLFKGSRNEIQQSAKNRAFELVNKFF